MTVQSEPKAPLDTSIRNLLRIAVPISLGSLVQFLVVLTDNFFLSRAGELEINGAGNAALVYLTFVMAIVGGSTGIQILVARFQGKGDDVSKARAARAGRAGMFVIGVILAAIALGVNALGGWGILVQHDEVREVFLSFLSIRAWGLIPFAILMAAEGDWIGQAKSWPILVLAGTMALTNMVLDAMWVEGLWGGTGMGADGAAYASLVAESVGALVAWQLSARLIHPASYGGTSSLSPELFRQWWQLSSPVMAQFMLTIATWTSFFFFVERVGMLELKVSHITRNSFMLASVVCMGLGQTARTVVSTLLGEGRPEAIVPVVWKLTALTYLGVWVLTHGYLFYPSQLARLFFDTTEGIEAMANTLFTAFVALQLYALSAILIALLQGAGFTKAVFVIELTTVLIYMVSAYALTLVWPQTIDVIWRADWVYFGGMVVGGLWGIWKLPWRIGHASLKAESGT